ncbi:DUF6428 family protein [Spongiivirga sp. MCCC 1A20706]|uniref:DUF6428 family protein n=1 Tax=Spongiivirga sp. MCCC 1A20706 TaxID=3160963 RepID=UPI003977C246
MKTSEFLSLLKQHTDKALLFEYSSGMYVGANYHITEVKNITVDAVDCGANTDSWKETVVQLWESPTEIGKTAYLTVYKALSILTKVDKMKSMEKDAEVKFEYGNALFHTAHLFVNDYEIKEKQLIINLAVTKTDCKAKDTCGVDVAETAEACAPGSGCC